MNIAFFDFDGTMSQKDSLLLFVKFLVGKKRFYQGIGRHFLILLGYMLGIVSNAYAKERLSRYFFAGYTQELFTQKCEEFLPFLEGILKDSALMALRYHQSRGDEVVVVSASFENYLLPLCARLGVGCIGTRLEVLDGLLSGAFEGLNCYGAQKVVRIREKFDLTQYAEIYVYGDSKGDREMLALTREENRFYRNFK
ncbi:hypothetical protein BKH46_00325 [Helicobacter sp. 12S02634-8]|uniref:HAD-IB family hydrolase n=1 Tax=Helicobacter sp. 12S02634-8 TaxID=1476199 RepID=UPI000BA689B7|nr:HAD-IB family hydrolase [Helicobacter sp. 12S02634-8]PAF48394.1 hypothetical protein BKH46_00325 [Helicobacter sp. 12S02634-8]